MEETPAVEDDGADQDLEEEAAVEEENSRIWKRRLLSKKRTASPLKKRMLKL